jgi:hypothetical protein
METREDFLDEISVMFFYNYNVQRASPRDIVLL